MARGVRARGASSQGLRITDPDAPFDEKAAARAFGLPADGRALATLRARQKADIGAFVDETMKGPKAAKGDIFYDRIDPDQARRIEPHLATYLGRDHNLKHAVRVIDRDAVRHILKEHGADRIPIKPDDIHHAPEVLRTGELVSVHQNDGKEVMILRRKLVDKNWLYVGESIRGSGLERIRRPTLSVKSMYWTEGPSQ
ncbi:MAG: hypothetical protein OXR84_13645 [Magnetovibrio sp.]|nr:hypothetical protein [Magnetovibrio sp.]